MSCETYISVPYLCHQIPTIVLYDGISSATKDIFCHQSSIHAEGFRSLAEGEAVEFDLVNDPKGLREVSIIMEFTLCDLVNIYFLPMIFLTITNINFHFGHILASIMLSILGLKLQYVVR